MTLPLAVLAVALAAAAVPAAASQDPIAGVCSPAGTLALQDDLSGVWSPCAVPPGTLLVESMYLQNASAVGGTALAAYPMIDFRTGVVKRLEFVFHAPSQIAESGPHGIGLYPTSHLGYGTRYTALQTDASAVAVVAEVLPPTSRFAPSQTQSKYLLGLTAARAVRANLTVGASAAGVSSGTLGFERILPSFALKAAYATTPSTQLVTDVGTRITARRSVAQSFGDAAVNQTLRKNLTFKVGLGTTFNPVSNAKAHYLASGFNYRI